MNRRPRATAAAVATALVLALAAGKVPARAASIPYGTGLLSSADGGQLNFTLATNPALPAPTLTSQTSGIHVVQIGPGSTYQLTSDAAILAPYLDPKSTAQPPPPAIILDVTNGQVVPPVITGSDGKPVLDSSGNPETSSPLTLLSTSKGTDLGMINALVGLKDVTGASGSTTSELLGLSLVSTSPAPPPPPVTPPPPSTPVVTTPPPPVTPVVTPAAPEVKTPEPLSLVLWSAVLGVGLFRARTFRRQSA